MRMILLATCLWTAGRPSCAGAVTWYVDGSVPESGDGKSWQTAFKKIQEGIAAASDTDTVIVARGTYAERIRFDGKNITMVSTAPLDPGVVEGTIIDGAGWGWVVTFSGTEDATCALKGFTIRNGWGDFMGEPGAGIRGHGTYATIENNIITGNQHRGWGGGIAECHGLIQNNIISKNMAGDGWSTEGYGGGLYGCDGTIRKNIIMQNFVEELMGGPDPYQYPGKGAGLAYCDGTIEGNIIYDNFAIGDGGGLHRCNGVVRGNAIVGNLAGTGGGLSSCDGTLENCIIWGNEAVYDPQLYASSPPTYSCIEDWIGGGEGNISEDPRFVDGENRDFRLRRTSPCIDAGLNDPDLPGTDIAGMHRIMFGGKSLTVDMGAYEFYINKLEPVPATNEMVFTWSSLADKSYSIFYTDDLFTWHTAIDNFPSSGNQTTSWADDGSLTGVPPSLAPKRFYRILEGP